MKPDAIKKKVARIDSILDRIERGMYVGESIGNVTDQIAWLWKFRHISYEEMTRLTAKARYVISTFKPE